MIFIILILIVITESSFNDGFITENQELKYSKIICKSSWPSGHSYSHDDSDWRHPYNGNEEILTMTENMSAMTEDMLPICICQLFLKIGCFNDDAITIVVNHSVTSSPNKADREKNMCAVNNCLYNWLSAYGRQDISHLDYESLFL